MAFSVSGCSRGSTAFSIDGVRTTQNRINEISEGCATAIGLSPVNDRTTLFNYALLAEVGEALSVKLGKEYTEAAQRAFLNASALGRSMQTDPVCDQVALGYATFTLLTNEIHPDLLNEALSSLVVEVNPRYGTWDHTMGAAVGSGSLSTVAKD
jgi:hypothetical protein